ncbi:amino acid permease [Spiroplasma culicicola]|uniref:Amino acid permease n=1 Tax=Spiroplasma culicicola AES-1 TaxID=1276246 RepID=W6A6A9_9MOLU|nr:amino acid permease [Spiroplasma culicicola]AHI52532.1 amino acid permease [Spiroplasma culicicola AES-1]
MSLNKKFGFWSTLMMMLSATLGVSLLVSFNLVFNMAQMNPILMILAWVIGGIIILPETFLMVEPSISFNESGTSYAWIRRAQWKSIGFSFGWILNTLVSATAVASSCASVSNLIVGFIGFGDQVSATVIMIIQKSIALGLLFAIGAMLMFVKNATTVSQFVATFFSTLPILVVLITAIVLGSIKDGVLGDSSINENLGQVYLSSIVMIPAIAMTTFAYSGVEAPTYIVEEIKNPEKNLPKAIIIGTIIVIVVYVIYAFALLTLTTTQDEMAGGSAMSMMSKVPDWVKMMFNIFAIVLFIASINTFLVYQSRLIYKMAESGDCFSVFTKTTKSTQQPYLAMLLLMAFASFYVLFHQIIDMLQYFSLAVSFLKMLMVSAIIKLRLKDKDYKKVYKDWVFWCLVVTAYATCLLTLMGAMYGAYLQIQAYGIVEIWKPLVTFTIIFGFIIGGFVKTKLEKKRIQNKKIQNKKIVE